MYERFSPSARYAIQLANQSCQRFDHYFEPGGILPLHVLDGILQIPWGGASDLSAHFGMDTLIVRNQVIETLSKIPGMPGVLMGKIPYKPETKQIIENAIQEAESQASLYVGTEHLLFGIAALNDTEPAASLIKRWLDCETIHEHLWVISYDSLSSQAWKVYRDWHQSGSKQMQDDCLKTALSLAPEWKSQYGCRLDDAIDLLNHALHHRDCPENLTVQWLTQFVGQVKNEIDKGT
jgi:ATP-dependent Clp protease ATP-binding subunit ClpA